MGLHIACLIHFANNLLYNQLSVSWFWAVARGGGKGKREQKKKGGKKKRLTHLISQMISVRKNSCNKDSVLITYAISFISPLLTLLSLAVFIH